MIESGLELNDFDEAIIIDHLQNEEELNKISADRWTRRWRTKRKNSKRIGIPYNQSLSFLSLCAEKLAKGTRLNIKDKLKIIELHKNDPIIFSIHKLSDILNINRSTISRLVDNKINFRLLKILKDIIFQAKEINPEFMNMKRI